MKPSAVGFLTVVNLLNYLDRYLLAAALPLIAADLSLTNEQSGRLASAFVFGYFIFSPIFGSLGDRYKRPALMAIGVGLWSVATLMTGLFESYLGLLAIRAMVGIGEASYASIAPGYIKDRISDPKRLSNVLAVFFSAIPVGSALGYVVAGAVAKSYDWHMIFFVGGAPGLVLAAFLLLFGEVRKDVPRPVPLLSGVKTILGVRVLFVAIFGYAAQTFGLTGIATFITKLGVERGFTVDEISYAFGLILVATGFIGTLGGGRLATRLSLRSSDRISFMFKYISITTILAAPFLAIAFVTTSHAIFLACCTIAELLVFAGTAPLNLILVESAPPGLMALTQGFTIFVINFFGSLLGPVVIGLAADATDLSTGLQLTTVAVIISGLMWWSGVTSKPNTQISPASA